MSTFPRAWWGKARLSEDGDTYPPLEAARTRLPADSKSCTMPELFYAMTPKDKIRSVNRIPQLLAMHLLEV